MKKNDVTVVMCKCKTAKLSFGIRTEKKSDNAWHCTWAFKLAENIASKEGYGGVMVSGKVVMDPEYPGCPYCGGIGWFSCGNCNKLTCCDEKDKKVKCMWCGNTGILEAADHFNLSGSGY